MRTGSASGRSPKSDHLDEAGRRSQLDLEREVRRRDPYRVGCLAVEPLPPEDELAELASETTTFAQMRAFLDLVGDGRPLTKKGHLRLADARALCEAIGRADRFDPMIGDRVFRTKSAEEIEPVELLFAWARAAGLLRVAKGRMHRTKRGTGFGTEPLEDWWRLFVSFVQKLDWPAWRDSWRGGPFWAFDLESLLPILLATMASARRAVSVGELGDATWRLIEQSFDTAFLTESQLEWWPGWVASTIWHAVLSPLADLGVFELSAIPIPREPTELEGEELRAAAITPFGRWAVLRYGLQTAKIWYPLDIDVPTA